jgi:hypothetical protein
MLSSKLLRKSYEMSPKEKNIYLDICLSVEGNGATIENMQIIGLPKCERPIYVSKFVKRELLEKNQGEKYFMTRPGGVLYQRLKYSKRL